MSQYPFFRDEPWHPSELEDYNHARNDDERRQMLLIFGYDEAHRRDAERLFGPTSPAIESALPVSPDIPEPCSPQDPQHRNNDNQAHSGKFVKICKVIALFSAIVGFIASLITIALAWPDISRFVSRIFHP